MVSKRQVAVERDGGGSVCTDREASKERRRHRSRGAEEEEKRRRRKEGRKETRGVVEDSNQCCCVLGLHALHLRLRCVALRVSPRHACAWIGGEWLVEAAERLCVWLCGTTTRYSSKPNNIFNKQQHEANTEFDKKQNEGNAMRARGWVCAACSLERVCLS